MSPVKQQKREKTKILRKKGGWEAGGQFGKDISLVIKKKKKICDELPLCSSLLCVFYLPKSFNTARKLWNLLDIHIFVLTFHSSVAYEPIHTTGRSYCLLPAFLSHKYTLSIHM